ncbi:MAG: dihydrodipicolinate synthase family protein, partial [Armatimonadetes bacterium]|nr:dihydrodipicolinate synthase family protein [Armatimonadota bacterium]
MAAIFQFEGIYTPLVTPYKADESIDFDALSDVIEFLISKGVHGLISGGSTGENYTQTVAERIEIARFCKDQIKE